MNRLIICDMYGTLVKADKHDYTSRSGFEEFWEYYCPSSIFAISTDQEEKSVEDYLKGMNCFKKFRRIYGQSHMNELGGQILKDLTLICESIGIPKENTIFIGDNSAGRDENSAFYADIRFIKVPQFRDSPPSNSQMAMNKHWINYENPKNPFTFKSLIGNLGFENE